MNILLIDNYDSFTYNIVELLRQLNYYQLSVQKNDQVDVETAAGFDKIILSPGPATPQESGNLLNIIDALAPSHSILGICLGHQAIAVAFGAQLKNERLPYHGHRTHLTMVKEHVLFDGIPKRTLNIPNLKRYISADNSLQVGLYHSWTVDELTLPNCLEVTSYSSEKNIMSLKHKKFDVHGVQFHPESYMTSFGKEMLGNFLQIGKQ